MNILMQEIISTILRILEYPTPGAFGEWFAEHSLDGNAINEFDTADDGTERELLDRRENGWLRRTYVD